MKITVSGSIQFESRMSSLEAKLRQRGYEADVPAVVSSQERLKQDPLLKRAAMNEHFAKIDTSEALLVANETKKDVDGYIGGNTLMEMAYAYGQGLDIFLLNPIPDMSYTDEIRGMQPVVLHGNLDNLDNYIQQLPRVFMSTTSALKHAAVARAMRRVGIPVRVDGIKVESGVNEQPLSVEETYEGALNRHAVLKALGESAAYLATIESGQHHIHKDHSMFGCSVVVLEKAGESMHVGIDLDLEFPKEMLDRVPSVYPDLGVLVQQEYGATEKDPFPYLTGGRLTRQKVLEKAVFNVAVQLERE